MILTVPLQPGTVLANVNYAFIVGGVQGAAQTSGITQPSASFAVFRFNVSPPAGAEEMVAWDATNLNNWNVAQLKLAQAASLELAQPSVVTVTVGTFTGRLVTFRSVYESILRRMGYDPWGDAVKQDVAQNVLSHINDRVRFVWPVADWPALNLVEWRVFRTIWTSALQFNTGDDLYYLGDGVTPPPIGAFDPPANYPGPNAGYYNCTATAPPGTLPTNASYFVLYGNGATGTAAATALSDRYIAYAQINQNMIGELLDVYPNNPREVTGHTRILKQAPSSHGVDVRTGLDAVWIRYRIPPSQFTLTPYLGTVPSTYYYPVGGDCYFINAVNLSPSDPQFPGGTLIPFPFFLAGYVRAAAYSDTILETTMEAQARLTISQAAMNEAMEYLQREIDTLAAQGHREYYPAFPSRHRHGRGIDIQPGAIPVEVFPPNFTGN